MARPIAFDETEILGKAVSLFWKQGYMATSPEEIVSAMGISRSSLYNTYGDKKTLFLKSLKRYIETEGKALVALLNSSEDAKETISYILENVINKCPKSNNQYGCLVVNTSVEFSCQDLEIKDMIDNNNLKILQALSNLIGRSQHNGLLSNTAKPH